MKNSGSDEFEQVHVELLHNYSEKLLFNLETRYFEIGWIGSWIASSNKRGHTINEVRSFDRVKEAFQRFSLQRNPPPFAWKVYLAQRYPTSYWQSEGKPPHFIKCAFDNLVQISQIAIYLDFPNDQSYTPLQLTIHWGMCPFELFPMDSNSSKQFNVVTSEPSGWVCLMKDASSDHDNHDLPNPDIFAKCLTISVMENHRGGNDTRIREIRLYTNNKATTYEIHK